MSTALSVLRAVRDPSTPPEVLDQILEHCPTDPIKSACLMNPNLSQGTFEFEFIFKHTNYVSLWKNPALELYLLSWTSNPPARNYLPHRALGLHSVEDPEAREKAYPYMQAWWGSVSLVEALDYLRWRSRKLGVADVKKYLQLCKALIQQIPLDESNQAHLDKWIDCTLGGVTPERPKRSEGVSWAIIQLDHDLRNLGYGATPSSVIEICLRHYDVPEAASLAIVKRMFPNVPSWKEEP